MEAAGIRLETTKDKNGNSCLFIAVILGREPLADQTLSETSRTIRSKDCAA